MHGASAEENVVRPMPPPTSPVLGHTAPKRNDPASCSRPGFRTKGALPSKSLHCLHSTVRIIHLSNRNQGTAQGERARIRRHRTNIRERIGPLILNCTFTMVNGPNILRERFLRPVGAPKLSVVITENDDLWAENADIQVCSFCRHTCCFCEHVGSYALILSQITGLENCYLHSTKLARLRC